MLHRYGLTLGLKLLVSGHPVRSLRFFIQPFNNPRHAEHREVWRELSGRVGAGPILDLGSPKLLALWLAARHGARVHATGPSDYFFYEYELLRRIERVPPERLALRIQDGRRLDYPDAHFAFIYAISAVARIPDEGDSQCLREMARVLAPGGRCVVTVPFGPRFAAETREPDSSWSAPGGSSERVFYQWRYDEAALHRRLIEPSGLRLRRLEYLGEAVPAKSPRGPFAGWRASPGPPRAVLALEKP